MSAGIAQSNTRAPCKGHGQSHEPGHHGEKERLGRRALGTAQNNTKLRSELGVTARAGRLPRVWFCYGLTSQHVHKASHFSPHFQKGSVVKVYIPTGSVSWHHLVGLN